MLPARRFLASSAGLLWLVAPAPAATPPDPDARAAATEARMSDAERYALLHTFIPMKLGADSPDPPKGVKMTAGFSPGVPRLGVRPMMQTDASLGIVNPQQVRPGDVATALPSGLLTAATFDPAVARAGGVIIGQEAHAKGFNVLLGPGLNLARDPRNGRNFEYLGEDPLLAGTLAAEVIQGIQAQRVVATAKHFALNDQETLRNTLDARIGEAALRESDLLAFEIAIRRGQPGAVMCAYNQLNGAYACGNDFLLNKVLRQDWAFKGWVMSDWGAVHAVDYAMQGLDQQAGANVDQRIWFDQPLRAEVAAGRVPKARVSEMVRRILRSLYATGADEAAPERDIDYAAHAAIVRRSAADGIVLLKNDGVLPLSRAAKKILVVGGNAEFGVLTGAGSSQVTPVGGPALLLPLGGGGPIAGFRKMLYIRSSPLEALRSALPDSQVEYNAGYDAGAAAAAAKSADVAIVFATKWQMESMDSSTLALPEGQDELIAAVAAANANTVVVLETGNPVAMPWLARVKAVVEAWYPGQEGGPAIADVLTGAVNPSGRLPMTFPADLHQNPRPQIPGFGLPEGSPLVVDYSEGADVGYRWFARQSLKPLFPFGHGLSYTQFEQGGLSLRQGPAGLTASFTVRNTGSREGATVPQLYLVDGPGKHAPRLVGFAKLRLAPGESRQVSIAIEPRTVADWTDGGWRIAPGEYRFALATSAADAGERATIRLRASKGF
jgi:beta-glucosidase